MRTQRGGGRLPAKERPQKTQPCGHLIWEVKPLDSKEITCCIRQAVSAVTAAQADVRTPPEKAKPPA